MLEARDWHQVLVNLYRYAWVDSIYYMCRPEIYQIHPDLLPKYLGFLVSFSRILNLILDFSQLYYYYSISDK